MNQKSMLTSAILLIFSWITGSLGIIVAGLYIFSQPLGLWVILKGLLIIITGVLLAAIVRMLGNIGQLLFELKSSIYTLYEIKEIAAGAKGLNESIDLRLQTINDVTLRETREILMRQQHLSDSIDSRLNVLNVGTDKINKDLIALSKIVNSLKDFFDQIGKHLELNK